MSKLSGVQIKLSPDDDVERTIKRFSKIVRESGVIDEVYERRFYVKPSQKKREKKRSLKKRL